MFKPGSVSFLGTVINSISITFVYLFSWNSYSSYAFENSYLLTNMTKISQKTQVIREIPPNTKCYHVSLISLQKQGKNHVLDHLPAHINLHK